MSRLSRFRITLLWERYFSRQVEMFYQNTKLIFFYMFLKITNVASLRHDTPLLRLVFSQYYFFWPESCHLCVILRTYWPMCYMSIPPQKPHTFVPVRDNAYVQFMQKRCAYLTKKNIYILCTIELAMRYSCGFVCVQWTWHADTLNTYLCIHICMWHVNVVLFSRV